MSKKIIYLIYTTAHLLIQSPLVESTNSYYSKTDTSLEEEEETFYQKYKTWIIAGCTVAAGAGGYIIYKNYNKEDSFNLIDYEKNSPEDIANTLKKTIKGNEETLESISYLLHEYLVSVKNNTRTKPMIIALKGDTGSGKSTLAKAMAKALGFGTRYVMQNTASFTSQGYQGKGTQALAKEVDTASGSPAHGSSPICFVNLDEFDKLQEQQHFGSRDLKKDVQNEMLAMFQDDGFLSFPSRSYNNFKTIYSKNLLIVCSGIFKQIRDYKNPKGKQKIIASGIGPELAGRIDAIFELESPSTDDLVQAQKNIKDSIYNKKKEHFKKIGIDFSIEDDALRAMIDYAYKFGTGVRGLTEPFRYVAELAYKKTISGNKSFSLKLSDWQDIEKNHPVDILNHNQKRKKDLADNKDSQLDLLMRGINNIFPGSIEKIQEDAVNEYKKKNNIEENGDDNKEDE